MSTQDTETRGAEFDHETTEDYEVGYCKPPKEHQFKPGNTSGKGRKKGSKGMKTMVNRAFGKKVGVKEEGRTRRKPKSEVGLDQLATGFARGDPKATAPSLQLLERYSPQEDPEGPSAERVEANLDALEAYLAIKRQIGSFEEEADGG